MRKLATIQTIKSLERIEGKDRIVYASFENVGFRVIVSTDFAVGEKVVYCEVDSLLPITPAFEFLKKRCYIEKLQRLRIKNMKMSGLYSEGIVFKTTILEVPNITDGMDVTSILDITKYDEEAMYERKTSKPKRLKWLLKIPVLRFVYRFFNKKQKSLLPWPSWARKSDETRAQNLNYMYDMYTGQNFYCTEKLDGCSALYAYVNNKFIVCSRNFQVKKDINNHYWKFAIDNDLERIFKRVRKKYIKEDFYIQGELVGPNIQKNRYNLPELHLFVFNLYYLKQKRFADFIDLDLKIHTFKKKDSKIRRVPFLGSFVWGIKGIDCLLHMAKGRSLLNVDAHREGIVVRSTVVRHPDQDQANMCSFKVINPDFECG